MNEIEKIINQEYDTKNDYYKVESKIGNVSSSKRKRKLLPIVFPVFTASILIISTLFTILFINFRKETKDTIHNNYDFGNVVEIIQKTKSVIVTEDKLALLNIQFFIKGATGHNIICHRYMEGEIETIELSTIGIDKYSIDDKFEKSQFISESGMISYSLEVDIIFSNLLVSNYSYNYCKSNYKIQYI